jgi:hypothetical protein
MHTPAKAHMHVLGIIVAFVIVGGTVLWLNVRDDETSDPITWLGMRTGHVRCPSCKRPHHPDHKCDANHTRNPQPCYACGHRKGCPGLQGCLAYGTGDCTIAY